MEPENSGRRIKGVVHRVGARVRQMLPLGIAARLTISFIAVAALAATANLIASKSVSVILWSTQPSAPEAPLPPPVSIDKKHVQALASAINRFELASQLRALTNSTTNNTEYGAAQAALQRAAGAYLAAAPPSKIALGTAVTDYIDHGRQAVVVADQRRSARAEHSKLLEEINDRLQATFDGGWKIFGRVLARQSPMQLRIELDAVRRHSEGIVLGEILDANDLSVLEARENAFNAILAKNETEFARTQGADWVQGTRADFIALVASRASLANLNSRYNEAIQRFSQNHAVLFATLAARWSAASASAAPPEHLNTSSPPLSSELSAQLTPNDLLTETAITHLERPTRNMMAIVTAIAMLLVSVISVLTVRSVVTPVRRILRVAGELAGGNAQVRVERGGIRELDTLANALNDMASRIAAAQAASRVNEETLEETVRERTHKLQRLALQDPLTSLPNRRHLSTLLNDAIERAAREKRYVGVFFLDVDNFKNFNDSLGHVFGDRVLLSVANRLEEIADSLGFVARLGGDEFTVVYEDVDSEHAIHETGMRIVQAFQQLLLVDDRELSVSVSVGASIYPAHGRDAAELLRAADSALFRAKELGRSRLAMFTPELIESAASRFAIEQGLRRALEHDEFELLYQPEVDLATMEVALVEALIRWRMPDGRLALPGEFLIVAEQSGLIAEISKWVLRTAIRAAAHWHHGEWPGARVAINISPRQLLDPRFAEYLAELLREFRLPATAIELELTETVIQTGSTTIAALRSLQSQGFGIALDDFGTGYSSLTSLEQLPLSRIKMDRSLIASIDSSPRSAAIARAIIDLCSGLGLAVTAEGVERPAQLSWLLGNRSIYLQGYLLSEAVSFDEVLRSRSTLAPKLHSLLLSLEVDAYRPTADVRAQAAGGAASTVRQIRRAVKS
jgi:diguanylate cyclase (GGDEF)-like protein